MNLTLEQAEEFNIEELPLAQQVELWLLIKQQVALLEAALSEETKPLLRLQSRLSGSFDAHLEATGATSARTPSGTVHLNTRYTASVEDADAFMEFVKENNKFDLLERRASAIVVRDYAEEHKELPPGVRLTAIRSIGVRKASGKDKDIAPGAVMEKRNG